MTFCLQPGQEHTWDGRPYRTKYILAIVRDQRGQIGMEKIPAILYICINGQTTVH